MPRPCLPLSGWPPSQRQPLEALSPPCRVAEGLSPATGASLGPLSALWPLMVSPEQKEQEVEAKSTEQSQGDRPAAQHGSGEGGLGAEGGRTQAGGKEGFLPAFQGHSQQPSGPCRGPHLHPAMSRMSEARGLVLVLGPETVARGRARGGVQTGAAPGFYEGQEPPTRASRAPRVPLPTPRRQAPHPEPPAGPSSRFRSTAEPGMGCLQTRH